MTPGEDRDEKTAHDPAVPPGADALQVRRHFLFSTGACASAAEPAADAPPSAAGTGSSSATAVTK